MSLTSLNQLNIPDGCFLRRKELFEYTTPGAKYNVELFENHDGTFYAIGVPEDQQRLVVYGTNTCKTAEQALQILIGKIQREGIDVLFHDKKPTNSEG